MTDPDHRKDSRRKKIQENHHNKNTNTADDERRFINKSKKQFKRKIEDMRAEERWEDWEDRE